jgi:hypothetical protein
MVAAMKESGNAKEVEVINNSSLSISPHNSHNLPKIDLTPAIA